MIKLLLLAVVPFMTEHRNVAPRTVVSTNFYGSVTGIVDNAYIQAHGGGGANTNAVLDIVRDEIIPATNRLDQTLSDAIDAHVENKSNPHAVTAEQVGALPLVEDSNGKKTAVTIGNRLLGEPVGHSSLANGGGVVASGGGSYAGGFYSKTRKSDSYSFAWNGDETKAAQYSSHGPGTFNINPYGGLEGFWIGEQTLAAILTNKADEFTEWEFSGDKSEGVSYSMSRVSSPLDGWKLTGSDGTIYYGEGTDESVSVDFEFSVPAHKKITATRKRVLRTGDAATPQELIDAISTNNPAFVSAVQNTPTSGMPDDMPTDWGTYGTVGAALAALAAGLKWCKNILGSLASGYSTFAAWIASKLDRASLLAEYSATSAYSVGAIVCHDGSIYQCKTAIADGGEAWNAEHWGLVKLYDLLSVKADKATPSAAGNLAALTADGDLADSGKKPSDFRETTDNTCHKTTSVAGEWSTVTKDGDVWSVYCQDASGLSVWVLRCNGTYYPNASTKDVGDDTATSLTWARGVDWDKDFDITFTRTFTTLASKGHTFVTSDIAARSLECGEGDAKQTVTVENGVAKLDDFFTESNSLLTGTIDAEVISKGTAPDAHLEAPTDERLMLILADDSVAYDSAKALPYKLTSAIGDRVIATMTLTAASTDITLPTISANDTTVKDFILDVTNAYAVEDVATDAGINIPRTDFKLVTRDGESLTDVTTVKAGKSAFICFTQKSPVVVDGTTYPCWCVIQLPFGDPS